ncbi:MAG: pimeloyl-ACP methyl ester carboxylesterase [Arenicella sp.]
MRQCAEINAIAFPNASGEDWQRFAKRTYSENKDSNPVLAYDPKIAEPLNDADNNTVAPNLWPVFDQICNKPMLLVRGELSDILEPECVQMMRQKNTNLEVPEIPNVGHAPMLSEPAAKSAIEGSLSALTSGIH